MIRAGEVIPEGVKSASVWGRGGVERRLGESFPGEGEPMLLVFLRHFGCVGCSVNVAELGPRFLELGELGFRSVLVGHGSVSDMEAFILERRLDTMRAEVFTDPTREVYHRAGLARSVWGTFGPRGVWDYLSAVTRGHENLWGVGDWFQMGGTVLVNGEGVVEIFHRSESLGGHLRSVEVVERALRMAMRSRGGGWV